MVLPEGKLLCEAFGLDPLGTIASGALLLTLDPAEAGVVIHALAREAIDCHFIGQVVERAQGVTLVEARSRGRCPSSLETRSRGSSRRRDGAPDRLRASPGGARPRGDGRLRASLRDGDGPGRAARGGTAADAAIATNAVLAVTQPNMCGVGGDLFVLYYEAATRRVHFLNGAGRSGSRASLEELKRRGAAALPVVGAMTVSVPGCVRGWACCSSASGRGRSPRCSGRPSTTRKGLRHPR